MKKNVFIIILICFSLFVFSQKQKNDSLFLKIQNSAGIEKAIAFNRAATFFKLVKPDTSLLLSRQALQIAYSKNDQKVVAESIGTIAESFSYLSQFDSSAHYYLKAIPLSEKLNNRRQMASYYNGFGSVLYQLGDFEKAISYMKMAAELKLKDKDLLYYAVINGNIAAVMQRMGNFKEAISILLDSEIKLKSFDNIEILANLYNSLGSAYLLESKFKNLDSAEYYYAKNISLITKPEHEPFRLAAIINISDVYIEKKQYDKAETNLLKALALTHQLSRNGERINVYGTLSSLYEQKNEFKKALEFKNLQNALRDSIYSEERERLVHDLESKYQIEKRDLTIKQQELFIEKEKNKNNLIVFLAIITALSLLFIAIYFWLKKRAKENLEKAKSKIFHNIVHEIRTPLTLIHGPLTVLKKDLQNENNKDQFELISQNSNKLVALVDELLLASKLERDDFGVKMEIGDIILFTKDLIANFNTEASKNNIQLKFNSNIEAAVISFPANAYEKVINNLISNAIKYNKPSGSVEVEMLLQDNNLCVKVKDTGIGLSEKEKENLFERFYRAESQKNKPGFGIGLSIVKELMNALAGKIEVESEPGKGTTFIINIPVALTAKSQTNFNENEITENDFVLIVEDDNGIYDFIKSILDKENIKTMRAFNGHEGFKTATELLPTIIITDVMMPVEDGTSMTKSLKASELTSHIPIIMLSAKTSSQSRIEGMSSGADAYLNKPFNPEELVLLIKNTQQTLNNNRLKYSTTLQKEEKLFKERVAGKDEYLKKIVDAVDKHILESDFSVNELADVMCISRSQLHRKISSITGLSTTHFIRIIRLEKAKDLLLSNSGNVTEIAYQCGFNSQSYFSKSFTEHFGKAPSDLIK
ncbi:MAG: tetratricopeptide repeat protein [Bacteroidota bacterium]|nr:tetratricopeptide repeat protein [Bacteroidota bacterium]